MIILVVVAIITLVFLVGGLLAFIFSKADHVVTTTKAEMVAEEKAYSPGATLGFRIKPGDDPAAQMEQARREAAKRAAALPRGANSRVGVGVTTAVTASKALKEDPITAAKIAQYHGWDGARSGIPAGGAPAASAVAAAPVAAVAAAPAEVAVVAGRDYVEIPITAGMSPEEVRKARAANAKARSAAMKAAKASQSGVAAVAEPVAAAGVATAAVAAAAPAVVAGIEPPALIEITDAMSPEEIRKARVANSKAMSAYNKALKAAGGAVGEAAPAVEAAAAPAPAAVAAVAAAVPAAAAAVEKPDLIEITDAMSPEEIRKARVANSKAMAAYNKALKAAGIDPASLN